MSRLTKKTDFIKIDDFRNTTFLTLQDLINAYNKLIKLEDLEEQLGCPLEVVFKALTNGIYQEDGGRRKYPLIEYNGATKKFFFGFGTYCNVEDYKKTWWLKEDKSE